MCTEYKAFMWVEKRSEGGLNPGRFQLCWGLGNNKVTPFHSTPGLKSNLYVTETSYTKPDFGFFDSGFPKKILQEGAQVVAQTVLRGWRFNKMCQLALSQGSDEISHYIVQQEYKIIFHQFELITCPLQFTVKRDQTLVSQH
ncbi:uncharacterized protein EV154DRAFT_485965 [Mucor mucedo]|uniref:uncharacterized protein n=1 Tax=Mucor mucedo TaxID=29922 RepID=UPI002220273D|nr:uncharacterized protein EV154DRAFT_485965 [Mucor mucedo]KAI7880010.1 hypothetical protein EV154DRAFT_485965 [Mucor mucedo]